METMNMIQPISTDLPMKKTKQTRRRKIIVPQDQKLLEMFTTDIERIQMYINSSPFADKMDAKVIRDINEHAVKMSVDDFDSYMAGIGFSKSSMITYFQNIIDNNARIHKILRTIVAEKKHITEEDAVYIMNWEDSHHSHFRYIYMGERQSPDYEYDEDDFSVNSEYEYMFNNNIEHGMEPNKGKHLL